MIPEQAYSIPIQIRFNDLDALGHVNNATQLSYLEVARVAYFEHLMKNTVSWDKEGIILAKANIDYKQPILLHDKLQIKIWCSNIGEKSFDLAYVIAKQTNEHPLIVMATAITVQVCFNYHESKSILIPERWKEILNNNLFPAFKNKR